MIDAQTNPPTDPIGSAELPGTMRAVCRHRFGPPEVLELDTVAVPEHRTDQVLVRVVAAALNPHDWHMLTGTPFPTRFEAGLRTPSQPVLGLDVAGTVVAVGDAVSGFEVGDHVIGAGRAGLADYVALDADKVQIKPETVTFGDGAALPVAAITALQGLRDHGGLEPGQRVLINGASGGVGTYAVQLAKLLGANVTGVCSARNVELVRSLGADQVIDYTTEDFTATDEPYDLILDNVGNRRIGHIKRSLTPAGTYIVIGGPKTGRVLGPIKHMAKAIVGFEIGSRRAKAFFATLNGDDLGYLVERLGTGELVSVIDRSYPMTEAVEAMQYLATGRARGKIIITI